MVEDKKRRIYGILTILTLLESGCEYKEPPKEPWLGPNTPDGLNESCINGIVYYSGAGGAFAPKWVQGFDHPQYCGEEK